MLDCQGYPCIECSPKWLNMLIACNFAGSLAHINAAVQHNTMDEYQACRSPQQQCIAARLGVERENLPPSSNMALLSNCGQAGTVKQKYDQVERCTQGSYWRIHRPSVRMKRCWFCPEAACISCPRAKTCMKNPSGSWQAVPTCCGYRLHHQHHTQGRQNVSQHLPLPKLYAPALWGP